MSATFKQAFKLNDQQYRFMIIQRIHVQFDISTRTMNGGIVANELKI